GIFNVLNDQTINNWQGYEYFNNAGTFRKSGAVNTTTVSVNFTNTGTVDVESGIISLTGSHSLTNGLLNFGISNATSFGTINLSGAAALAGTLSANLNNGYLPPASTSFQLVTYGSEAGAFNNLNLPTLGAGLGWQLVYGASAVSVQVVSIAGLANQITGVVTNDLGAPVTNITVFAYTTNSSGNIFLSTTTDASGHYVLNVS